MKQGHTIEHDGDTFVLVTRPRTIDGATMAEATLIRQGLRMGKDFLIYFPKSKAVGNTDHFKVFLVGIRTVDALDSLSQWE